MEFIEEIIRVLQMPQRLRSSRELSVVLKATKDIEFFAELTREEGSTAHELCCEVMTLEKHPPGSVITKIGEKGEKFYVILQGKVSVNIPDPQTRMPTETEEPQTSESSFYSEPNESSVYAGYIEIAELEQGSSFGAFALLYDKPRSATVITKEVTYLAVLAKEDFQRVLGSISRKRANEKIEFLYSMPFFRDWTRIGVFKLSFFLKNRTLKRKQVLYQEGDPVEWVYFVKEGEFKVMLT